MVSPWEFLSQCFTKGNICLLHSISALWLPLFSVSWPFSLLAIDSCSTTDVYLSALIKENPLSAFSFACGSVFLCCLGNIPINHHSAVFSGTHFRHTGNSVPKELSPMLLKLVLIYHSNKENDYKPPIKAISRGLSSSFFPFLIFTEWILFEARFVPSHISIKYLHRVQVILQGKPLTKSVHVSSGHYSINGRYF